VRVSAPMISSDSPFVSGEIDVPSPASKPRLREFSQSGRRSHDSESDTGKTPPHT
jgi:hypothetical protein